MFRPVKPRSLRFEQVEDRSMLAAFGTNPTTLPTPIGTNPSSQFPVPVVVSPVITAPVATPAAVTTTTSLGISGAYTITAGSGFLTAAFQAILNRQGDSETLAQFSNQLNIGTTTPAAIVDTIWNSLEHRTLQVSNLYRSILGRTADADGLAFWVSNLQSGMTLDQLKLAFINSGEFEVSHLSNSSFVTGVYRAVYGKAPTNAQLALGVRALNQNTITRENFSAQILNSHDTNVAIVNALYTQVLRRAADAPGAAFWVSLLDSKTIDSQAALRAFLSSGEFLASHRVGTL